ncbi:aldo/keto reductase [Algoriphagus sediminis]|uniref:Aldo/keto reductase n=1 Tax=Algoriphagus sediminis TaxID=3057113 RepID=A0ABT7YAQ5_9BACT|nr:aldo/keto reductase [Algoriphagus sediminis]MDN3203589.1 aldo/keto reductase [Algoriphagus sediminis]
MKNLKFQNGDEMPILGLGTWKSKPGEVKKAVYWAIEAGYRHLDCARIYQNEKEVGEGIDQAIREGLVKREELFVTSKLWNNAHKKSHVRPAIEQTLNDLGLDYLDLYLVHWPLAFGSGVTFAKEREDFLTYEEAPLTETWQAMQEVKKEGLTKHIGVSNFNQKKLKEIFDADGQKPEMNQIEMHPFLPQKELVNFCKSNGILMTAYSPLGSGDSRTAAHENDPVLLKNETVLEIGEKHGASAGQVLIAWSIARDIAVIPKSANKSRIKENFDSSKINLDSEDLKNLDNIGISHRFVDGTFFTGENSPYTLKDLWD